MNLTTLNANEGWPVQTHFYYNSKQVSGDNLQMFANDNFSKEEPFELIHSSGGPNESEPREPMSEALYDQHYPIIEQDSHDYRFSERIPRHCVGGSLDSEPTVFAVDTGNPHCALRARNASFVTNYSHFPVPLAARLSQAGQDPDAYGEKKFISELHINIKEASPEESSRKHVVRDDSPFLTDFGNYCRPSDSSRPKEYHLSSFETYIESQNHEEEGLARNHFLTPDNRPSSESPTRRRECHLAEKFIYLGHNSDHSPHMYDQSNDANSSPSPNIHENACQRPVVVSSKDFDYDELKSFTTKSVQTVTKVDCMFKQTCDRSVETDFVPEPKELRNRPKGSAQSSRKPTKQLSDSESGKRSLSTENMSEIRVQNFQCKPEVTKNANCSPGGRNPSRPVNKEVVKHPNYKNDDTNQDTYAGSYSETFSHSNEMCESLVRDKPEPLGDYREIPTKKINRLTETKTAYIKKNITNINSKLAPRNHPKKGFSDRKDTLKFSDRNSYINDLKQGHISKEDTDRHSLEIQCLLDNLNTHLQNTVNSQTKPSKNPVPKGQNNQFSNIGSFWDNPLNPETTRSLFLTKQITPKNLDLVRQKTVNPEIQAIFETLEKSHNQEKVEIQRMNPKQLSNMDLNVRKQKMHNMGDNYSVKMCGDTLGSVDNLQDTRFPSNLKFQKSFELSPYDELVKSHLNSSDRRIKSVAAKNGCRIVIDGPISLIDTTTTCQAIRNKIAYRCAIAGPSKDRLDKCLNYLKETFPNTCLRLHCRNSLAIQS